MLCCSESPLQHWKHCCEGNKARNWQVQRLQFARGGLTQFMPFCRSLIAVVMQSPLSKRTTTALCYHCNLSWLSLSRLGGTVGASFTVYASKSIKIEISGSTARRVSELEKVVVHLSSTARYMQRHWAQWSFRH